MEELARPPVSLTVDYVMAEDKLFLLDLDGLKKLENEMFLQTQREADALTLKQRGAYYIIQFQAQRKSVEALRRFIESHLDYSPLASAPSV